MQESSGSRGGAIFVASRDGDLEVFADAASACAHMEAIDVEEGEYAAAFRVDGVVLALRTEGEEVVLVPTGEVDASALRALIADYARRTPSAPRGEAPLDVAEAWLTAAWHQRWPRRPVWLDRWLHGSGPPIREELAAPP